MIQITFKEKEGEIICNKHVITNLKKPFKNIVHSIKALNNKKPYETFEGLNIPLTYYVFIKKNTCGTLFKNSSHGFPSHFVYETNKSISSLFRDKVLHEFLYKEIFKPSMEEARRSLQVVLSLLAQSFDVIITDMEIVNSFNLPIPVVYDEMKLIFSPESSMSQLQMLKALLKEHREGLPIRLFDWRVLQYISLPKHSTFDFTKIKDYENILILVGTNNYLSGFLAKELRRVRWTTGETCSPLPVTLFSIP